MANNWQDVPLETTKLDDMYALQDAKLNLPAGTTKAQVGVESSHNTYAVNKQSKARGLAQIMPETQAKLEKRLGKTFDPFDPEDNLEMHYHIMKENLGKFKDPNDALRAYNAGWNKNKWNNKETNSYIEKISTAYDENIPVVKGGWQDTGISASNFSDNGRIWTDVPLNKTAEEKIQQYTKEYKEGGFGPKNLHAPSLREIGSAIGGAAEFLTKGAVQAIGTVGAGALGAGIGALDPKGTAKEGWDALTQSFSEATPWLNPVTEGGQRLMGAMGAGIENWKEMVQNPESIAKFTDLATGAIPFIGKDLAKSEQLQAGISGLATAAPELLVAAGAKAPLQTARDLPANLRKAAIEREQALQKISPVKEEIKGQGELFPVDENVASPYNPNKLAKEEPIVTENPALARRQMELQLEENPIVYVDKEGRPVHESVIDPSFREFETRLKEAEINKPIEEQLNLFDEVKQPKEVSLLSDKERPLTLKQYTETLNDIANEPTTRFKIPENIEEAYAKYVDQVKGKQLDLFEQKTEIAKQIITEKAIEQHPQVKRARTELGEAQAKLNAATEPFERLQAERMVERAEKTLANAQKNVKRYVMSSGPIGKQAGASNFGISKMIADAVSKVVQNWKDSRTPLEVSPTKPLEKLPGISKGLRDFEAERRGVAEIKSEAMRYEDIKDTLYNKLTRQLQTGFLYQSVKFVDPVFRKVETVIRDAENKANYIVRELIQKDRTGYAASLRDMTRKEKAELHSFMLLNEGKQAITPEILRSRGFNDKQISAWEAHTKTMQAALEGINSARASAGKPPIEARTAYMAGVFSGDFKRVFLSPTGEIVGVIGARTKWEMNRLSNRVARLHPDWKAGEVRYTAKGKERGNAHTQFEQTLEFLAENDPNIKAFTKTLEQILTEDAYNMLNLKKHTKQKKGVFGSEGKKEWESLERNAEEGFKAQVRYAEQAIKWGEMSKAVQEIKPLLSDADLLNQRPKTIKVASDYVDRALGYNPSEIGRSVENVFKSIGEKGIGYSNVNALVSGIKKVTVQKLLGFANIPFLTANALQSHRVSPIIGSLLSNRGLDNVSAANALVTYSTKGTFTALKELQFPDKLSSFEKQIISEGKTRGIFESEIFDHSTQIQKGFAYKWDQIAEIGINPIEAATRGTTFASICHMLEESGYKPSSGTIFDIAERITDMTMVDYSAKSNSRAFQVLGPIGSVLGTLSRYKFNQLSMYEVLGREAGRNKEFRPLATAIATDIAFAGILGTIAFQEADTVYQAITKSMGSPDTLTNLVLENTDDLISHGGFFLFGLDMSSRLGSSNLVPDTFGEIIPGATALADTVVEPLKLVSNPSKEQASRAVRAIAPSSATGLIDSLLFSETPSKGINQGKELSISPKTGKATATRNETDSFVRPIGFMGLNESKQKASYYNNELVKKAFDDIRTNKIQPKIRDAINSNPNVDTRTIVSKFTSDWTKANGDPTDLVKFIEGVKRQRVLTQEQNRQYQESQSNKLNQLLDLQRRAR